MESVALLFSSGRHTPATVPAHHDVRAQPCVDCAAPLGELSALFPSHLRQEPRCFSFEGASWRGAEFPHPFLQPQCCLQCSLEWEGDRVQAEHDARLPFLALDFPVVQRKGATAGSLDGWGWRELKVLPVSSYDELARILTKVEDFGVWPDGPLSVLPIVYRVWASARMSQLEDCFRSWVGGGMVYFFSRY